MHYGKFNRRSRAVLMATVIGISAAAWLAGIGSGARAQAIPTFALDPVAEGCSQWGFAGDNGFHVPGGDTVAFTASGKDVTGVHANGRLFGGGRMSGGINGSSVNINMIFPRQLVPTVSGGLYDWNQISETYTGTVDANGNASGDVHSVISLPERDNAPAHDEPSDAKWVSGAALTCLGHPALKITDDVDIYAEPGGVGSPLGIIKKGTSVEVLERRDDNWVHISFFLMTRHDQGWVWGDFVPKS